MLAHKKPSSDAEGDGHGAAAAFEVVLEVVPLVRVVFEANCGSNDPQEETQLLNRSIELILIRLKTGSKELYEAENPQFICFDCHVC